MQILIWRDNRWEPFPEEELCRLRENAKKQAQEQPEHTRNRRLPQRTRSAIAPDTYAEA
ncbi:MAG: hypothetical protein ACOYBJ_01995 [Patescibacteria group bacterium]